jgi:hypothetical protein
VEASNIPDEAVVVRGGALAPSQLQQAAGVTARRLGRAGISAWYGDGVMFEAIVRNVPKLQEFTYIHWTTAQRIRGAGFGITATPPINHCTIWIPMDWYVSDDGSSWTSALAAAFSHPTPNPHFE